MEEGKTLLADIAKMCVAFWLACVIREPLHEYGHYWAASALGIDTYIDGDRVILVTAEPIPEQASTLLFLAGGIISGSVLLFLFFLLRKPYAYGLLPLVAAELAYAPFDGTPLGYLIGACAMIGMWAVIVGLRLIGFRRADDARNRPQGDPFSSLNEPNHALFQAAKARDAWRALGSPARVPIVRRNRGAPNRVECRDTRSPSRVTSDY